MDIGTEGEFYFGKVTIRGAENACQMIMADQLDLSLAHGIGESCLRYKVLPRCRVFTEIESDRPVQERELRRARGE